MISPVQCTKCIILPRVKNEYFQACKQCFPHGPPAKLKVFGTLNSFPLSHLSFCLLSVKLTCQTAAFHTPMWYVSHAQLAKSSQTSLNCLFFFLFWFLFATNYDVGCHQVICSLQRHWTWLRFAVFPLLNVVLKSSVPKKLWQRKHMLTATQ